MSTEKNTYDLLKLILNLLIIGLFIIITYCVVKPFLFGFFWAVMVVIATWPLMIRLQQRLFNKRYLSVLVITIILSLLIIIPSFLVILNIAKNGEYFIDWIKTLPEQQLPTFDWLNSIPLFGDELHQKWIEIISIDSSQFIDIIQRYILPNMGSVSTWIVEQIASFSIIIIHSIIMIIFCVLLFLKGEAFTKYCYHFAYKLSHQYGEAAITLAGQSIRAVALGVVVTALTLALLGGLSFIATNMPYAGFLTLVLFICCVIQIGPVVVMMGCIIWQFADGNTTFAIILFVVAIILAVLDSLMRAFLIKKGADLPFLLILFGVIGGLFGFGLIGIFIGPVVLTLVYKLVQTWVDEQE